MSADSHFEVYLLGAKAPKWRLVLATVDRAEALSRGETEFAANPEGSVCVLKEVPHKRSAGFDTVVLWERGPDKLRGDASAPVVRPPCRTVSDFGSPAARRMIGRTLEGWLARRRATPLELLHQPQLVDALEASDSELQHAIQKAVLAQSSPKGEGIHDAIKRLMGLVDDAGLEIRRRHQAHPPPAIRGDDFVKTLKAVRAADPVSVGHSLRDAVAAHLGGMRTWSEKIDALVKLALNTETDATVRPLGVAVLAEFLDEAFQNPSALHELVGAPASLGLRVDRLVHLFLGRDYGGASAVAKRVSRLLRTGRYDGVKTRLGVAFLTDLKSSERLVPDDFDREVALMRRLADTLVAAQSPLLALDDISEAFTTRSARLLDPGPVEELLRGAKDPHEKARRLLALSHNLVGAQTRAKLGGYVRGVLTGHAAESHFIGGSLAPLAALSHLAQLQREIAQSALEPDCRAEMVAVVDGLGAKLDDDTKLFERIAKRKLAPWEKAAGLMRLAASEALPAPRCQERAMAAAMGLMRSELVRSALQAGDNAAIKATQEVRTLAASVKARAA